MEKRINQFPLMYRNLLAVSLDRTTVSDKADYRKNQMSGKSGYTVLYIQQFSLVEQMDILK